MNRKMEQKNKSNRCSSLFSSGIYITFCTGIYKNIGKFEIEFSFAVISSCLNKQTNKWVFPSVDKVATNFGCDFVIQQPLKSTRQCTINNNDTKKVDQHCIKTCFTSLGTSSFALFFSSNEKIFALFNVVVVFVVAVCVPFVLFCLLQSFTNTIAFQQ